MKHNIHYGYHYILLPALWLFMVSPSYKPATNQVYSPGVSVVTKSVKNITATSADCYFSVTDPAKSPKTVGVCISKGPNPDITNKRYGVAKGSMGPVDFRSEMTGLTPYLKYYVRAYCTTTAGTVYGNEISFTTLKPK